MVDGWAGAASEILRPWGLLSYHIQNAFFVHTEMDKVRAMDPGPIIYYVNLAQLQLYFLMGLVYSVITPIILPFVVVTFAINYVVYRHQVYSTILLQLSHHCLFVLFFCFLCVFKTIVSFVIMK